jgi:hypothetical protein
MSLAEMMHEDRRGVILRALDEADQKSLSERTLERVLLHLRLGVVGRDLVRGYLTWLESHGLVRVERLPDDAGELWVATATKHGTEVARGRRHPGVAEPPVR